MISNCKTLREKAYASLQKDLFSATWMILILCALIAGTITSAPGSVSGASYADTALAALIGVPGVVASILLGGPFSYALARMYHKTALGEKVRIPDVFNGFKENFGGSLLLALMQSIFVGLWSLLFIVPGIIKSYAYSMAFFIQAESKGEKNWRTCLDESIYLTKGYKGKLFLLDLSFIGWYIVGCLCLGVGAMWVSVYHMVARAHFYEELKSIKYGSAEGETTEQTATALDPDDVITPDASAEPVFAEMAETPAADAKEDE